MQTNKQCKIAKPKVLNIFKLNLHSSALLTIPSLNIQNKMLSNFSKKKKKP